MIYVMVGIFWILQAYLMFIIVNIFLSWVPFVYKYSFFRTCKKISDWYLLPFRGVIVLGMFDLTPIIGLFLYQIILETMLFMM